MYLNEDTDLVELRDSATKVNIYTVAKVLSVVATPFLTATAIAFDALRARRGNYFQNFAVLILTGTLTAYGWLMLYRTESYRKNYPYNWVMLTGVGLVSAAFLGGICAYSYLGVCALSGLCIATTSMGIAAAMTSAGNKSRLLRRNMWICGIIGLAVYIAIFKVLWDMFSHEKEMTYRAIFVIIWCLCDLPFSMYFPYALILYVIPEQDDPEDFIQASMKVWTEFPWLVIKVILHWREVVLSDKVTNAGSF